MIMRVIINITMCGFMETDNIKKLGKCFDEHQVNYVFCSEVLYSNYSNIYPYKLLILKFCLGRT